MGTISCPICGARKVEFPGHHCSERTLRGIDAANQAAWNAEDPERDNIPAGCGRPSVATRLNDGFCGRRGN
jgi:hypothetical protein